MPAFVAGYDGNKGQHVSLSMTRPHKSSLEICCSQSLPQRCLAVRIKPQRGLGVHMRVLEGRASQRIGHYLYDGVFSEPSACTRWGALTYHQLCSLLSPEVVLALVAVESCNKLSKGRGVVGFDEEKGGGSACIGA